MTMANIRFAMATVVAIAFLIPLHVSAEVIGPDGHSYTPIPVQGLEKAEVAELTCKITSSAEFVAWGMPYSIQWSAPVREGVSFRLSTSVEERAFDVAESGESTFDFPVESAATSEIVDMGITHVLSYKTDPAAEPVECASVTVMPSSAPQRVQAAARPANPDINGSRYTAFIRQSGDPDRAVPPHIGGSKAAIARNIRECESSVFYDGACDALVEALRSEGLPITDRASLATFIESDQVWTERCTSEMLRSGHMYRYDRKTDSADSHMVRTRCYKDEFILVYNSETYGREHKFLLSGCINPAHYLGDPIPLVVVEVPVSPEPKPLMNLGYIPPCECAVDLENLNLN